MAAEFALTDTHCHLDFSQYNLDRDIVIERSREAGIKLILNPGIDVETSRAALKIAEKYPEVFVAVGVHPNSALSWNQESYRELEGIAQHPKVVAIGEIGLDYYRHSTPVDLQIKVFKSQLECAGAMCLPVVIHNRDAHNDIIMILDEWCDSLAQSNSCLKKRPGTMHSFSGDMAAARWAVEKNFCLGITGPVTYKNATQVQQVARDIPLRNLLIETDSPYLPPHPHRGERNEPAHVEIIAGKIAMLRKIDVNEVGRSTSENALRLFRWRKID